MSEPEYLCVEEDAYYAFCYTNSQKALNILSESGLISISEENNLRLMTVICLDPDMVGIRNGLQSNSATERMNEFFHHSVVLPCEMVDCNVHHIKFRAIRPSNHFEEEVLNFVKSYYGGIESEQ